MDTDGGTHKGHLGPSSSSSAAAVRSRRKGRRKPVGDQRFSAYLSFGLHTTVCLSVFLVCYALLLLCLFPLLDQEVPAVTPTERGAVLRPVVRNAVQKIQQLPHAVPGGQLAENVALSIQKKIQLFRKKEGVTDSSLLNKAVNDIEKLRKQRRETEAKKSGAEAAVAEAKADKNDYAVKQRNGFMVLGMHRSGTSMLSGLLVTGMGYKTGGPLIGSAFDNEKGFFELLPLVLQNDAFMGKQRIWWSAGVISYDSDKALQQKKNGSVLFEKGTKALAILNNKSYMPYLNKDPRMCITLKTWLPLLNHEPAILFTYRHPLEVAMSLKKRENNFELERGLRLWIVYNMRGVQNSADLCRVTTSNDAVLADPLKELQRVSKELTERCGVPAPSGKLVQDDVDKFIDPNLQHNNRRDTEKKVLMDFEGCKAYEYKSDYEEGSKNHERERDLYLKAMKIYCDFNSGVAYKPEYEWPELD